MESPLLHSALATRAMLASPSQHTVCTPSKGFILLYKALCPVWGTRWMFLTLEWKTAENLIPIFCCWKGHHREYQAILPSDGNSKRARSSTEKLQYSKTYLDKTEKAEREILLKPVKHWISVQKVIESPSLEIFIALKGHGKLDLVLKLALLCAEGQTRYFQMSLPNSILCTMFRQAFGIFKSPFSGHTENNIRWFCVKNPGWC